MPLSAGIRLGPYEVLSPIGAGGMGEVYRARDTRLGREVAIKVLPAARIADAGRRSRFAQEARAASALNHPNIVAIYDINQANGVDFLVMELVRGKTLDQLIGRNGLRLTDTLRYALQIIEALSKAHGAGIVHRDLKPTNVMVTEDGVVKLLDFGLAKLDEPATSIAEDEGTRTIHLRPELLSAEGTVIGTIAYMAPEQAEGKKVDARADVFSFGALLYEMVTGHRAFTGDSSVSTLAAVIKTDPKPPSQVVADVPRDLERIILRCLRKDAARRFQSTSDIKVELEDLKEESDSGRLAPPATVSRGPSRTRWIAAGLAIPVLVAAVWYLRPVGTPGLHSPIVLPFTTYDGLEAYPTFSPDGNQVAFTWDGEKCDNQDIYVRVIGTATALRLTSDPAPDIFPASSPDGRQIAFLRGDAIYLIPPIGGQERKLADVPGTRGRFSWSADGKWIAVAQADITPEANGIFLISAEGGGRRRLTTRQGPSFDAEPAVSPDGKKLAYANCTSPWSCQLDLVDLDDHLNLRGAARRLKTPLLSSPALAWSADGQTILYDRKLGFTNTLSSDRLWRTSFQPGVEPERLEYTDDTASFPALSRVGRRLVYTRDTRKTNIWKWKDGRVEKILSSTQLENFPQYSPDGRKIAFQSTRSGLHQVWVANADGSGVVQLTNSPRFSGSPYWSPDGHWIAYDQLDADGRWDIWVIDSSGGQPRQLTTFPENENAPSFSRDGKWVYFYSNHTGRAEIYRIAFAGGTPVRLTENGGMDPSESWDGLWLYYQRGGDLYVRSLNGGPERQFLNGIELRRFCDTEHGRFYITKEGNSYSLRRMGPATDKSELLGELDQTVTRGISVSPDGKSVLYTVSIDGGADLRLVENFR
jgi:Tol biopolymer transport system component